MSYCSLHNHTMYSLLDGYGTPEEMLERCKEVGIAAYAITEHSNEYSWVYFDKLKLKYPEIKIIYGVELYECFDTSVKDKDNKYFHLIALARNEKGRKALNAIITKSNFDGFYYKPRVQLSDITPYAENLVICSACLASKLARESDYNKCVEYVNEYKRNFPYFFLEMQSHSSADQEEYNKKILRLSKETNTPFIITTDSHAARKEDLKYQGRHVQIAHDSDTMSESYEGCYLQSEQEIHEIMDGQIGEDNVSMGLEKTNVVSSLIEDVSMPFQDPQLPTYPLPDGFSTNNEYLWSLIKTGYKSRGFDKLPENTQKEYKERIKYEMGIIHQMNFDGYFIIVWDFINYAKENGIKVGEGRGSAAGSLVCYTIGITNINPMKYGLIFERFLNPERISYPDVDTDLSERAPVIRYLEEKYGENRVCQILNFSFITPVVAIKDVGKVLGFKYAETEKLSKKFTYTAFEECIEKNKDFLAEHKEYNELIDIASHLSGRIKTVSCHAGGVGIVDTDINDYMAMKLGSKGEHVIQVDKRLVEEIGIIKFDILGVQTLSLVREIQSDLELSDYDLSINNPDFEYAKEPYELLQKADTNGVFQVESAGMKDLLVRLKPSNMEDLSAVLALYRPDTMGMMEQFIENKHDPSKITYIHEDMKPILESTYGCLIYQEQVMDIVRKFGGRSYGGADIYRKAIGKKNPELVKKESEKLYQEIINNGYSEQIAEKISNQLAELGGYCFNKSHSYCYAVLCFQTAYLKAKYPVNFFKALFNLNKDDTGKLNKYIIDAKNFGVELLPPSVNKSEMNFSVCDNKVLFGLSAIKGIGESFANAIIEERNKNGKFKSFDDFCKRISPSTSQVVMLTKSGAFPTKDKRDFLERYFKSLSAPKEYKPVKSLPTYKKLEDEYGINVEDYKINIGKATYDKNRLLKDYNEIRRVKFNETQRQSANTVLDKYAKYFENEKFWEYEALQTFIGENPFEKSFAYITRNWEDVDEGEKCTIVGIISNVQKKKDKHKNTFAFVNIYTPFGIVEGTLWSTQYAKHIDLVKKGSQVAVLIKKDGETNGIIEQMKTYSEWLKDRGVDNGDI